MRLLILGCGDIGSRVGLQMCSLGWQVAAVRRDASKLPPDFTPFALDLTSPEPWIAMRSLRPDYLLITPTPQSYDPAGYELGFTKVAQLLAQQPWLPRCRRVFWISSTRVYREGAGGWVDEHSPLNTNELEASSMVAAEAVIRRASTATIIRPAGIYGDPNGWLIRRVIAGSGGLTGRVYGNRIHRDDLARLIGHCLLRDQAGEWIPPTLVAADHDQTPMHEVERWLAEQLGTCVNPAIDDASRTRPSRRCHNALLGVIGFKFVFPTWREGYTAALAARS